MNRLLIILLTLLFSLSGPAMGEYSDFRHSPYAAKAADDFVPNVPVGRRTKIMSDADPSPHRPQHVNSPLQPVQNAPGTVNGIDYSGHAFDQMRNRGLVPSVVENALRTGTRTPGNTPGTTVVTDSVNSVQVIINSSGRVITVK
jgi:hypothetical protein